MRLRSEALRAVWIALRSEPFNASPELADAVERVLKAGNEIHGSDNATFFGHLRHAMEHYQAGGVDADSVEEAEAHTAARLILGLITLTKGNKR